MPYSPKCLEGVSVLKNSFVPSFDPCSGAQKPGSVVFWPGFLVLFQLDSGGFARPRVWCSKNGRGTGEEVRRGSEQRGGRAVARTDPQGRLRRAQAPKGTDTARGRRGTHRPTDSPGPGHRGEDGRAGEEALRGGGPPGGHLREAQAGQSAQAGRPSGGLPGGPGLLRSSRGSRQQALEHAATGREVGGTRGGR